MSTSGQVISKSSRIERWEAFMARPQATKSSLQRALRFQNARVLGDDVATTAIDEVGQLASFSFELLRRHVAQRLDGPR